MATIVNSPAPQSNDSSGGMGFLVGIIILVIAGLVFFVYGLPALRQAATPAQQGTEINVPDQIDVNVSNPEQ